MTKERIFAAIFLTCVAASARGQDVAIARGGIGMGFTAGTVTVNFAFNDTDPTFASGQVHPADRAVTATADLLAGRLDWNISIPTPDPVYPYFGGSATTYLDTVAVPIAGSLPVGTMVGTLQLRWQATLASATLPGGGQTGSLGINVKNGTTQGPQQVISSIGCANYQTSTCFAIDQIYTMPLRVSFVDQGTSWVSIFIANLGSVTGTVGYAQSTLSGLILPAQGVVFGLNNFPISPVPEPGPIGLGLAGLLGLRLWQGALTKRLCALRKVQGDCEA
jgi:hypothetical protein